MKCCVPHCNNNEKNTKKHRNLVTFHLFPRDNKKRAAWIAALEMPDCQVRPTERSTICSDHFRSKDVVKNNNGVQTLVPGALPRSFKSAENRICRVCLSLDNKTYKMSENYSLPCQSNGFKLDQMYEYVTGVAVNHNDKRVPNQVCWECAARLYTCSSFKSKALLSDKLLKEVLEENEYIKEDHVKSYHKQYSSLKSTLVRTECLYDDLPITHPVPLIQPIINPNDPVIIPNEPIIINPTPITNQLIYNQPVIIPSGYNQSENPLEVEVVKREENMVIGNDEIPIVVINNVTNNEVKTEVDLIPNDIGMDITNTFEDDFINLDSKEFEPNDFIELSNNEVPDNDSKVKNPVVQLERIETAANRALFDDFFEKKPKVKKEKIKKEASKKKVVKPKKETSEKTVRKKKKENPFAKPKLPIDENVFMIRPMTIEEQIKEVQERKHSEKYKMAPFKCTVCYMGFPTQDKLKRHSIKHSEVKGPLSCKICKIRFKKPYMLRCHMGKHSEEYICKQCPLVTRARCVALAHMHFHAGKKYTCPQCPTEFEKKTTLLNHLRLKHISSNVCELCGYTFVSEMGVNSHKRLRHCTVIQNDIKLEGPYCNVCDVKFWNKKAYERHLRLSGKHIESEDDPNRLSNDPSIKCRRIGHMNKKAERRPDIHRKDPNRKLNRKQDPVECEQCGVILQNHHAYALHFRRDHPGINRTKYPNVTPYMCDQCGKIFLNTTALENHQWVHTGEKRYECDHCHKTFSVKANLANHMQVHEQVRHSYPCRICGKVFAFSFNRNRHMFIHTGLRPHKCNSCEKCFVTSTELKSHVDYVHLKKPRPKRVRRKPRKCDYTGMEY